VNDHWLRGVLANRQNQNTASIALLVPVLPRLDPVADSAHFRLVLSTRADDYTKTYRYGDAADALLRLQRQAPASMSAEDLRDLGNGVAVRDLLRHAPRQRVFNSRPFAVPLRRDTIGLREVSVRAGADSGRFAWARAIAESRSRLPHGFQGGHRLDAIPEILQAEVLVSGVLVVIVVGDRHGDGGRVRGLLDHLEWNATTHGRQLDHGPVGTLDGCDDRLSDREIHRGAHCVVTEVSANDERDPWMRQERGLIRHGVRDE
jgi:hypothetical protein